MQRDEAPATTRLYLITPPALDPDRFAKDLDEALAGGDVACLQLRLKDVEDSAIRHATRVLQPIARQRGVAFIMNDRPDLAAELDCDGVHVGEEDMPYAEARRLLGPDRVVGVTCGASRDRAITAAEAGADYVAFGAFFPSLTKAAKHHADPELIRDWSETTVVPCCAIGGITQENCGPLVEAGADFLAVIGAIWSHPKGPRVAVADFNEVFARCGPALTGWSAIVAKGGCAKSTLREKNRHGLDTRRKYQLYQLLTLHWDASRTPLQGGFDNYLTPKPAKPRLGRGAGRVSRNM